MNTDPVYTFDAILNSSKGRGARLLPCTIATWLLLNQTKGEEAHGSCRYLWGEGAAAKAGIASGKCRITSGDDSAISHGSGGESEC